MIYKDFGDRAGARVTLEYCLRANDQHDHTMRNIVFVQGSSISDCPITYNEDGTVDVNLDDLDEEFEHQESLYKGSNRNGKFTNHCALSLTRSDTLTDSQWDDVIIEFQEGMGYEFDNSLYCGAIHKEKQNMHCHIISCRVDGDGKLISKHNSFERAQRVRDRICEKYGLTAPENSFDILSEHESNNHIDFVDRAKGRAGDSLPAGKFSYVDERNAIRSRIKQVFKYDNPVTITQYVKALKKRGVNIEGREGKAGECLGISYKLNGSDKSHSGSNVSSTNASWGSLLNPQRKNLNYKPERDNEALGLSLVVRARVKITKRQVKTIKRLGVTVVVRRYRGSYYLDLPFRSSRGVNLIALTEAILAAIMKVLKLLFGASEVRYYTALDLSRSRIEHDADNEKVYDAADIQYCMQAVEADAKLWAGDDDDDIHGLNPEKVISFK